jgi:phosphomannomutase
MAAPQAIEYRCPGERHPISESIHLGRLARFYPACRTCPHRDDTGTLSPQQVERLRETRRRADPPEIWTAESVCGIHINEIDAALVYRVGLAMGGRLREQASTQPMIAVASDGRAIAPELVEAVTSGLRHAGGNVMELGVATAGAFAATLAHLSVDGGILIGNPISKPHTAGLTFWGPRAVPWSSPGTLQAIRDAVRNEVPRPCRAAGGLSRFRIVEGYVESLREMVHALRPLRVRVETSCQPLVDTLHLLYRDSACEFVLANQSRTPSVDVHFTMWIDGDGATCRVRDERNRPVPGEHLFALLACAITAANSSATFIAEADCLPAVIEAVRRSGARVVTSGATRQKMAQAMLRAKAAFGGGPSGSFWHGETAGSPDALRTLALLLQALSRSDRALSQVLAASIFDAA